MPNSVLKRLWETKAAFRLIHFLAQIFDYSRKWDKIEISFLCRMEEIGHYFEVLDLNFRIRSKKSPPILYPFLSSKPIWLCKNLSTCSILIP